MANLDIEQIKAIRDQLSAFWTPVYSDGYLPRHDGKYEIFTTEGVFVIAYFISRKTMFVSEDGGDGYDALAWRIAK